MTKLSYVVRKFHDLSLDQLYHILALRQEVFIVEQTCPYQDADGKDQRSLHLMGFDGDNELVAYTRIVPPGISYENYSAIGRVITSQKIRGQKQGIPLMEKSVDVCLINFPDNKIKISAQSHLEKFYNAVGFEKIGEGYLEDDIPHIAMIREET